LLDEAFERYRRAALWGLVIGWLICPPENDGPEVATANIERTVTAASDLETLAAIEGWLTPAPSVSGDSGGSSLSEGFCAELQVGSLLVALGHNDGRR